MSNKSYTIYTGIFLCKHCGEQVKTIRVYSNTGRATWMCGSKHLSECQLYIVGYKKKKDYERENRE